MAKDTRRQKPTMNLFTACENLLKLPVPAHLRSNELYVYPPPHTLNVYNRGDAGPLLSMQSKRSSVLIALTENGDDDEIYVVLTQRTPRMRRHAGQVAFPGGKNEETDVNDYNAAMREAYEEVGVPYLNSNSSDSMDKLSKGQILRYVPTGELTTILDSFVESSPPHYVTLRMADGREKQTTTERLSSVGVKYVCDLERLAQPAFTPPLVVTPVIVRMDYAVFDTLVPNEEECNAVFLAPLSLFLVDSAKHSFKDIQNNETSYRMHHFDVDYEGETFDCWGMTADVLIRVASVVYNTRPSYSMNPSEDDLYPPSRSFVPHVVQSSSSKL
jgi:8-oxo-dGTP pyrophosphatase MutT (NUDIX family)